MRRVILTFLVLAPLVALVFVRRSPLTALGIVFVSHMLALYATLRPTCGWWGPVVTSFNPEGKEIWLTIDDGPHPTDTARVVEILSRFGAKATFFAKGRNVRANPLAARASLDAGHTLANHSDTHPSGSFWFGSPVLVSREIDRCNDSLAAAGQTGCRWFRAPVGFKNMFVHTALSRRGMRLIAWSARGFDGVSASDPARVVERICRDVKPGAIVLIHEGVLDSSGDSFSARCIEALLTRLKADGYRFIIPRDEQLLS